MTNPLAQDLGGVVRLLEKATFGVLRADAHKDWFQPTVMLHSGENVVARYHHGQPDFTCTVGKYEYELRNAEAIEACVNFIRTHSAEIARALRDAERWQPIESAPDDIGLCVVYTPDQGDGERYDFDWKEDGVWQEHYNHYEHFMAVGGANACGHDVVCTGPGEEPEYTHYRRLTPPRAAMGAVGAGSAEDRDPRQVDLIQRRDRIG